MKRKRTPSPPTQRRTSRSPLSPRSTRAAKRTPPSVEKTPDNSLNTEEDQENSIRRSSRARRLNYQFVHNGVSPINDAISPRSPLSPRPTRSTRSTPQEHTPVYPSSRARSRSSSPESEDIETPPLAQYNNHVRFSPSAKPSSPARFSRQRAAANIARMRLQNVPSEDEQSEFNRRYSQDLRSRRQQERSGKNIYILFPLKIDISAVVLQQAPKLKTFQIYYFCFD